VRKRSGLAALAVGVGGLGVWGNFDQAQTMEAQIKQSVAEIAASATHDITTEVNGRDIRVTGLVNDQAESETLLAAFEDIRGRRVVIDDLTVLPTTSPFTYEAVKSETRTEYQGFVPTEDARTEVAETIGDEAAGLTLSAGAPAGWSTAVATATKGLEPLKTGRVTLSDTDVRLTGLAATPAEKEAALAAVADLPEGFTLVDEIDVEDDGKPFSLSATFDGTSTQISGKVPNGATLETLSGGRGLGNVTGDIATARIDDSAEVWPSFGETGLAALGRLTAGTLEMEGDSLTITGTATPAGKADAESLLAALPDTLNVAENITLFDDGAPLRVEAVKEVGGSIVAKAGKVPADYDLSLAGITDPEVIKESFLTDETGLFDPNVQAGALALKPLREGSLDISVDSITVKGVALTEEKAVEARAALADLPASVAQVVEITVLDDGKPLSVSATKALGAGVVATAGKLPSSYDLSTAGVQTSDTVVTGLVGDPSGQFDPNLRAASAALSLLREGTLDVTTDTVRVTGTAATEADIANIDAALAVLPEGVDVTKDISVYDDGAPFALNLRKTAQGDLVSPTGKLPVGVAEADYGIDASDSVAKAQIADASGNFDPNVKAALAALEPMERGNMRVTANSVFVEGVARTPAEEAAVNAALDALPSGVSKTVQVTLLDDGKPPAYEITFDAVRGATASGKLPQGLEAGDLTGLMNVPTQAAEAKSGLTGDADRDRAKIEAFANWLPELESGTMTVEGADVTVTGVVSPGNDLDQIRDALQGGLGDGASVSLAELSPLPRTGQRRTNVVRQQEETFLNTAWIPVVRFEPTASTCEDRVVETFENTRVNFVTGSAKLDAQSNRAINQIAAVMRRCILDARLTAEVQGHTDSQGTDENNLALSQERADVVRNALIARGVPEQGLLALGYGETQPIASNDNADGRAANRRTEIKWSE